MAITLKNLTEKNLKTIAWSELNKDGRTAYNVYDGTPNSGQCLQNKFLGTIYYDSKKQDVIFNNVTYTNIIWLEKALFDWALGLPWCSDYYDPSFRVGIKEMYIIRDYIKSLGFKYINGNRYTLSGINHFFDTVYIDIIVQVDNDATTGKILFNSPKHGDCSWIEESFTDLDGALGKLNMLIGTAVKTDKDDILKVSFYPDNYSDYKILAIDENYQYALVVGENENFLWILSRMPYIDKTIYDKFIDIANKNGFNTDKLIINE